MIEDMFAALGSPSRIKIVEFLLANGETAAGSLPQQAGLSAPALSRHLKILREAGIVEQRVDAQRRLYSVNPSAIKQVADWSMTYQQFWSGSIDRLAQALDDGATRQ